MGIALRFAAVVVAAGLSGCGSGLLPGPGDDGPLATPSAYAAFADLGTAKEHFRRGELTLAETGFRAALAREPDNVEALVGLAATYDRLADWTRADAAYDRALALAGRRPEILNNLGYSQYLRGDHARARAIFQEAADLAPDNAVVQANLATVGG